MVERVPFGKVVRRGRARNGRRGVPLLSGCNHGRLAQVHKYGSRAPADIGPETETAARFESCPGTNGAQWPA
eukprot:3499511-Prorocentrum_lima.AAC.1